MEKSDEIKTNKNKSERILFIVPPHISFDSFIKPAFNERVVAKKNGDFGSIVADMPIGLMSISAYLKKNANVEIRLVNFNVVLNKMESFEYGSFAELFVQFLAGQELIEFNPTMVGISTLFTPSYYNMLDVAEAARRIFPQAMIIAGGGVPTNMCKEIFDKSDSFDALCFGEGEKPLLELVLAKDKKELLNKHPSWITKDNIEMKKIFEYDFIENLDEIPFYDFDILNVDDYQSNSISSLFPLEKERRKKGMPLMGSRGCPHHCCFCASHTVHGRKVRFHSVERIKEDMKRLRDQYGAQTVVFFDDHFMADIQRAYQIIGILKELDLTAFFPSSLTLYALDAQMLKALKSIGMDNLVLSVESGSERVLREIMHKPLNLSIVKRVIRDCHELGISTDISILIGLPGETKQDIEDARSFLKTLDATWFRISMATPLVGSEMFDICMKNNYIKGEFLSCNFKKAIVETEDFTPKYIEEMAYFLNLELNFVHNSEFRQNNFETALKSFENVMKAANDHAFAYYFAAKCAKLLCLDGKLKTYKERYLDIINKSDFWKNYSDMFDLPPLD